MKRLTQDKKEFLADVIRDRTPTREELDAEYEEIMNTPNRGRKRPESDFDMNDKSIPKGRK